MVDIVSLWKSAMKQSGQQQKALGINQMIYVSLRWVMFIAWIYFVYDMGLCARKITIQIFLPARHNNQPIRSQIRKQMWCKQLTFSSTMRPIQGKGRLTISELNVKYWIKMS